MNHYLKLLSSTILVGGISVVAAESAKPFSNFYVGVGTGYSMMNAISRTDIPVRFGGNIIGVTTSKKSLHSHGVTGKIFAGYEILSSSNLYGALEGYVVLDHQKATYEANAVGVIPYSEKFSRQFAGGLRAKLGWSLNDTVVLYGLVGAEVSRFSLKGNLNGKQSLWAATPGIGASFVLSEKTKLILEITRSCYKAFKKADSAASSSTRIKPAVNMVSVGLSLTI